MVRPDPPLPPPPGDPRPGTASSLPTAIRISITCLLVYLLTFSGKQYSIDGIVMFQYAKAILFNRSLVMDPPVQWGIEFTVSKWPIGLTLAYIPVLAFLAGTFFRADPQIRQIPYNPGVDFNLELLENRPYLYSAILNPLLTAASAAVLFGLCLQLGMSRKRAAAIALVYGIASPAAVYAKLDYAQPLAALFLLLAFYFLSQVKEKGLKPVIGAGLAMGIVILARPELVLLSPILAVFAFYSSKEGGYSKVAWRNLLGFGIPLLGFLLLNAAINDLRFGSWFSLGYSPDREFTLNPVRILTSLAGNLASPGRGLFFFFPLSILSITGLRRLRRTHPLFAWALAASLAGALLMYSAWKDWGAGVSWGPRFFIPAMPYLALLGLAGFGDEALSRRTLSRILVTCLVLLGGVVAIQGLLFSFTDFYSSLSMQSATIDQGDYNFLVSHSPIFRGWGSLGMPEEYDIFWLEERIVVLNEANMVFIPALALVALGYLLKVWVDFFRARSHP